MGILETFDIFMMYQHEMFDILRVYQHIGMLFSGCINT